MQPSNEAQIHMTLACTKKLKGTITEITRRPSFKESAQKGGKPKDFVNKKNNFKRKQKIYFYFLEEIKKG
jgi:hypothetical protein